MPARYRTVNTRGRRPAWDGYKTKTQIIAHNEARKVVKRAVNSNTDTKRYDGQKAYTTITQTGYMNSIFTDPASATALNHGDDNDEVIGDDFKPIRVRIAVGVTPDATGAAAIVRVVVFQVKGGATPTFTSLFQSPASGQAALSSHNLLNASGKGGFIRVLKDITIPSGIADNNVFVRHFTIKSKKLRTVRISNGDVIVDGDIYFAAISDNTAGPPSLKYYSSVWFKDA